MCSLPWFDIGIYEMSFDKLVFVNCVMLTVVKPFDKHKRFLALHLVICKKALVDYNILCILSPIFLKEFRLQKEGDSRKEL